MIADVEFATATGSRYAIRDGKFYRASEHPVVNGGEQRYNGRVILAILQPVKVGRSAQFLLEGIGHPLTTSAVMEITPA